MGLLEKLRKTRISLFRELRRILTLSPRFTPELAEELESVLLATDLGLPTTQRIVDAVRESFQTQGRKGSDVFAIAEEEVRSVLGEADSSLTLVADGVTVVSVVGVNGTGKTTTCAKLAHRFKQENHRPLLAACDTFRPAAIEQLQKWSERLGIPIKNGEQGADPGAIAHDAISKACTEGNDIVLLDTAGRLHTKHNLMRELEKIHRVAGKKIEGAPHEVLLVIDATTGANALVQARTFHQTTPLSGLVVTKLDGTSRGGMVVNIQRELSIPVKFVGVGEKPDDLLPFEAEPFAKALFSE